MSNLTITANVADLKIDDEIVFGGRVWTVTSTSRRDATSRFENRWVKVTAGNGDSQALWRIKGGNLQTVLKVAKTAADLETAWAARSRTMLDETIAATRQAIIDGEAGPDF